MANTYRISYAGSPSLGDPYGLASAVFPNYDSERSAGRTSSESDGSSVTVTFATPQTPVDLGPLVKVEIIDTPSL